MQTGDSLEQSLGKTESRKRRGSQETRWLDDITDVVNINLGKLQERVRDRDTWHATAHRVTKSLTQPGDWTTTTIHMKLLCPAYSKLSINVRNYY